jgi:hypothetical protein
MRHSTVRITEQMLGVPFLSGSVWEVGSVRHHVHTKGVFTRRQYGGKSSVQVTCYKLHVVCKHLLS